MNSEVNEILSKINDLKYTNKYIEYPLKKPININNNEIKNLIINLNNQSNTKAFYNPKTLTCDTIGVVDIDNIRIIDFDDNNFTLLNKGIDCQTCEI